MRFSRTSTFALLVILLIALSSCGGGGGGGGQKLLTGKAVNEAGAALSGGSFSVQGSGTLGTIGLDGSFTSEVSGTGRIILTSLTGGFRLKRQTFDASVDGGLNLGNVVLSNDSLSKGWNAYRAGNSTSAADLFQVHINASGRDIGEAYNGLGWAQARSGDPDNAHTNLSKALGNGFDADVRTGMAAASMGKTLKGTATLAEGISNLDLAVNTPGFYLSRPVHDNVSEDDLVALRAMLNLLDGRNQAAITDRNAVLGKTDAKLNSASTDMLVIIDFFLAE